MVESNTSNILPVGFYDLLFDEAELNHKNINTVLDVFFAANYRLIKPTFVEFEDSLAANSNCDLEESFQLTDVISGKKLTLRSDITSQISRLLATRLRSYDLPLKICYVGDVLRAKNNDLYADRQQTQVGLELIGNSDVLEVSTVVLSALEKINLAQKNKILIEFSSPSFREIFLTKFAQNQSVKSELLQAILQKNLSKIKEIAGDVAPLICEIVAYNRNPEQLLQELSAKISNAEISDKFASIVMKFRKISDFISEKFPQIEVKFDLFGDHKSPYSYDISFDIFCGRFPYAIACGGSYKINNIDAAGATVYMNNLRKIS